MQDMQETPEKAHDTKKLQHSLLLRSRYDQCEEKDSVSTHMKGEPHKLAMKLEHESEFMKQPGPLPSYAATPLGRHFSS